jgi:methylenetetrahydrofolate--tRNA-(uracil-5-)-methyltransferase
MVGFQTRLKHPEQKRIFRSLPGLENAEFVRLGSVHRNTFIDSPTCLEATLQTRTKEGLFFAGQITGVEGYVESTAGGLLAGLNASRLLHNRELLTFPDSTAIGALMAYISDKERTHFQPMNISFGLMKNYSQTEELPKPKKVSKKDKRLNTALEALKLVDNIIANSTN